MSGKAISNEAQTKRYGVLIASSRFPDDPKLQNLACPENDVDGLFEVLNDAAIGGFSELLVVKNQPSHEALRSVHKVLRKAGRDDMVLIYYAGHGKLDRAGRLHLATIETINAELETTSIPAQRLRDLIDNADSTKIALILDCCYSGAIEKNFLRGSVEDQLNVVAGGRGTFIMTAATDVQTAREEVREGYGVFTKHLIDGMRGAADVDGNGVVTMNELYDYVHRQVLAESHQVPMKWNLNVEGELVIAQTGRKPRDERRLAIRARLLQLANEGLLPDTVFTKALEISNLSFQETRAGAASRYDALLDRLHDEGLRIGDFVNDWLKVPLDDTPKPEPKPELKPEPPQPKPSKPGPEPAEQGEEDMEPILPPDWHQPKVGWFWKFMVFPYPATQENLDRHPFYRLAHAKEVRTREMARLAAGGKVGTSWSDVMISFAWVVGGVFFIGLMIAIFEEENISYFGPYDGGPSGGLTGALIWAAFGWRLMNRASYRLNLFIKGIYWLGIAACIALAMLALSEA